MATKWYTVFVGRNPGIYDNWLDCQQQVKKFPGARFKSFLTLEAAKNAFAEENETSLDYQKILQNEYLTVDAACSSNPGPVEYRGVKMPGKEEVFYTKLNRGTNNIGEFLAIVQGIYYLIKNQKNIPLFSDSFTAIQWVKQKKCNSTLLTKLGEQDELTIMIRHAENYLQKIDNNVLMLKWNTKEWGEIPADFGRK